MGRAHSVMMKRDLAVRRRFDGAVQNLLSQITPLLIAVNDCAAVVDEINALAFRRDKEQNAVNELQRAGERRQLSDRQKQLDLLNAKIDKLWKPFPGTEEQIQKFLRKLKPVLNVIPTEPDQLLKLREEIERLEVWEQARRGTLGMGSSLQDLMAVQHRLEEILSCLATEDETDAFSENSKDLPPGGNRRRERGPDLETSRKRIELETRLTTELTTIAQRAKGFTTVSDLRQRYPDFELWNRISAQEQKELLTESFKPKTYARSLVLRAFGITSRDTLKKDRQKLKNATR